MSPARSLTRCAGGCAAGAALGGCLAAERGVWPVLVVEATPSLKPAWELGGLEARGRPELLESGALGPLALAVQVRRTGRVGPELDAPVRPGPEACCRSAAAPCPRAGTGSP